MRWKGSEFWDLMVCGVRFLDWVVLGLIRLEGFEVGFACEGTMLGSKVHGRCLMKWLKKKKKKEVCVKVALP